MALLSESYISSAGLRPELGRAAAGADLAERAVKLAGGTRIRFDDLVVAIGARARPSPWGQPPGVHVLRTLNDAAALRDSLSHGALVVVGAG
ncbi:FAD-dependent oxidoreductase [Streptomyces sp. NBC_01231]|nr:FAD-dependent oxidoreductase [Streptomyces sp. NBC_01231]